MDNFKQRVELLVSTIPEGKVMTYGQIAAICGQPRAARIVGGIAHFGNPALPWHRVVNRYGGLASGYPGGRQAQKIHLEGEGITVSEKYYVDLNRYLYEPKV
jgi:methylated-DNA-protein-cysteine methyltransferase-like protein